MDLLNKVDVCFTIKDDVMALFRYKCVVSIHDLDHGYSLHI